MKKILFYLLLFGGITSMSGQGINDPFFNTGQARSLNNQIIALPQVVPTLVNNAMSNMQTSTSQNIVRLAHLKNEYGFAVWDMAVTFTAHGKETALIPMVRSTENSISGILVAVLDGTSFRYGTMDLDNPFPYASAPLNSPGMPNIRDVLAQFVIFNHTLFGTVNCNLIQALATTATTGNIRDEDESSVKSCYYQVTYAGQNCHHIYGTYPDGTQQYLYSDCVSIFNYTLVCSDTDAADTSDSETGGGGNGSSGSTSDNDDGEENSIHKCATTQTIYVVPRGVFPFSTCSVKLRISGCNGAMCETFLQGEGLSGCGGVLISEFGGLSISFGYGLVLSNVICNSFLDFSYYNEQQDAHTVCVGAYVEYDLVFNAVGLTYPLENNIEYYTPSICYTCKDCPN
ncbi:MAG: hypothetical protein KF852_02170 [Saprospiraceae bacterium]|nr:hypothetical protein [Saprospiraceae bacterium]